MNIWLRIPYLLFGVIAGLVALLAVVGIFTGPESDFLFGIVFLLILMMIGSVFTLWGLGVLRPNKFSHAGLLVAIASFGLFFFDYLFYLWIICIAVLIGLLLIAFTVSLFVKFLPAQSALVKTKLNLNNYILLALFFLLPEIIYTLKYWHPGTGSIIGTIIFGALGFLFSFRLLKPNVFTKISLISGFIFVFSFSAFLGLGFVGFLFAPLAILAWLIMVLFLVIGVVVSIKERIIKKSQSETQMQNEVQMQTNEQSRKSENQDLKPKSSILKYKLILIIGLIIFLIGGAYFLSFLFLGYPIFQNIKTNPTRHVVIKPAEGAQAPFSLQTHTIPIPDNFIQLGEGRGVSLSIGDLIFSPDGLRAAYLVYIGSQYLVVDNKAFEVGSAPVPLMFSKDSSKLYFVLYDQNIYDLNNGSSQIGSVLARKDLNSNNLLFSSPLKEGEVSYTIDSEKIYIEDIYNSTSTIFSPSSVSVKSQDGKTFAFIERGGYCGVLENSGYYRVTLHNEFGIIFNKKYHGCNFSVSNPVISPDGNSVAYFVVSGKGNFVAINDKPGQAIDKFARESIQFSPDGKYIAYGTSREDKLWWIVEEVISDSNNETVKYLKDIKVNILKDENAWRVLRWGYDYNIYPIFYPAHWNFKLEDKKNYNTDLFLFPGDQMNGKDFIHISGETNDCDDSFQSYVRCQKMFDGKIIFFTSSNNSQVLQKFDELIQKLNPTKNTPSVVVENNSLSNQTNISSLDENPTDGWINFQNLAEGFEIKRPGNWNSEENANSENPGKSTDLVFCPNTLADPGKVNCKKDIPSGYPTGMIYLYSSLTPTGNADYHYIGINKTGRHYYLYNDLADKTIFNKIIASFKFIP